MAAMDILTLVFDGPGRPENFIILPIATFIFYILGYLLLPASGMCILALLDRYKPLVRGKKLMYGVILVSTIIYFILLVLTPFANILYYIDENNVYSRGNFFFLALIIQGEMYISLIIYMIANRKEIIKIKVSIIIAFFVFPQIAQVFQLLLPGVSLVNTGYSLIFIIMFIFSNSMAENELKNAGNEIDEKSAEIERKSLLIINMQNHTIDSLSNLVENRDEDTGEHIHRTRAYVKLLATQLKEKGLYPDILTSHYIDLLERAAPMHDIGKIVIPDAILKKPGPLTEEEYEFMKKHTSEGGRIVHEILDGYEEPDYIQITADIATHHHEKWNGSGYPDKLSGEDIPLCARIMALADVFDALVSPRVYKLPISYEKSFKIIEEGVGTLFDPVIAREFLSIKEKFAAINESYKLS